MNQVTDIEKLQEIMEILPDVADHDINHNIERREYSLTKGDILLIYKIAKIANAPHVCPFEGEEQNTLQGVAKSINRTQKIASGIIIAGTVTAVFAGMWQLIKYAVIHFMKHGGN